MDPVGRPPRTAGVVPCADVEGFHRLDSTREFFGMARKSVFDLSGSQPANARMSGAARHSSGVRGRTSVLIEAFVSFRYSSVKEPIGRGLQRNIPAANRSASSFC